jgi:hypothetical protein
MNHLPGPGLTAIVELASPASMADPSPEELYDNFFENFTHSVAAVRLLLEGAHRNGSFIEGLMLYASIVDGLLRNLVALEMAPRTGYSRKLDSRYFVHDKSKWLTERRVYAEARSCKVIDDDLFAELEELYRFRNLVAHRFIVSPVAYSDIPPRLDRYNVIMERLLAQLAAIEQPDEHDISSERADVVRQRIERKLRRSN